MSTAYSEHLLVHLELQLEEFDPYNLSLKSANSYTPRDSIRVKGEDFLQADEGDLCASGADSSTLRLLLARYAGRDNWALGRRTSTRPLCLRPGPAATTLLCNLQGWLSFLGWARPQDLWLISKAAVRLEGISGYVGGIQGR